MKAFTIPTIFSAIDKLTAPVRGMSKAVGDFASKAEVGIARGERAFRKLTPSLSQASKDLLSFASTAAIAAGIVSSVHFSTKSLMDYEDAVNSFRTIVSDASDQEFALYKKGIADVANDTKKSTIAVAASFEKIAGLNATFAETADGLSAVSKASIILSKASKDELGSSAESLVGIMNQFSLGALEADRTINVLAAGQAVGAASITQTAESFKNFGSVASAANISLEQSVGLVQTLGKFSVFGAEAGTKLRGSVLKLQQAGVGYASGQFNINDALEEAKKKIDRLGTAKQKDAALTKMFGAENIATGRILLANIDLFNKYTKGVTGTNEANKAAEINSQSLSVMLGELKDSWVNIITTSDNAASGMNIAKTAIGFVTDNLSTLVDIGIKVLMFFAAWKAALIISKIALGGYNIILGITGALSNTASIAIGKNTLALGAYNVTTFLAAKATGSFAVALGLAGVPIWAIALAIIALIALTTAIILKWNDWGAALSIFLGPLGLVISLVQSFRRNWDMVKEAFTTGGMIEGLKAIGKVFIDAVLMPLQQLLKLASNLPGLGWLEKASDGIGEFRKNLGVNVTTDESGEPLSKPAINPKATQQEIMREEMNTMKTYQSKLLIEDKSGKAKLENENPWINMAQPKLSSTMGF